MQKKVVTLVRWVKNRVRLTRNLKFGYQELKLEKEYGLFVTPWRRFLNRRLLASAKVSSPFLLSAEAELWRTEGTLWLQFAQSVEGKGIHEVLDINQEMLPKLQHLLFDLINGKDSWILDYQRPPFLNRVGRGSGIRIRFSGESGQGMIKKAVSVYVEILRRLYGLDYTSHEGFWRDEPEIFQLTLVTTDGRWWREFSEEFYPKCLGELGISRPLPDTR